MKNIKSVEDVQLVPEDEHILTIDYATEKCPFCGARLRYRTVKWHHGTTRAYFKCSCEVAKAADAHNRRVSEIQHKAWLECRKKGEEERKEELRQKIAYKTATPVSFSALEVFSVIAGLTCPGLWFKGTLQKVEEALYYRREPALKPKNAKEALLSYAQEKGFREGLEKASAEIAAYIRQERPDWETDISDKVKAVCSAFGVPELIVI